MLLLAISPSFWVLLMLQVGDTILPIGSFILIDCRFVGEMLWTGFVGYQVWLLVLI
jgi:hypothetical protein